MSIQLIQRVISVISFKKKIALILYLQFQIFARRIKFHFKLSTQTYCAGKCHLHVGITSVLNLASCRILEVEDAE